MVTNCQLYLCLYNELFVTINTSCLYSYNVSPTNMKAFIVFVLSLAVASAYIVPDQSAFNEDVDNDFEQPAFIEDLPTSPVLSGRITNGNKAATGQFPYQVGLSLARSTGNYWCGGSLIGSTWVLTAAHCSNQ